jgi:hypothetical protein
VGQPGVEQGVPAADRFQGSLFVGESNLRRGDYFHAYRAFRRAAAAAEGGDRELALGLSHLAACGYKRATGDERGAQRQLAHARRRLTPFRPEARRLDLDGLIALVGGDQAARG